MSYISNSEIDRKKMMHLLGIKSFDELIRNLPADIKLKNDLNIPAGVSELEVRNIFKELTEKNESVDSCVSFLGGGAYDHYIPAVINHMLLRSEFYTAYTPYQPEVSQGTLQAIYEYQSMICELTGMDVSNASMYDAGSALAEAGLIANNVCNKKRICYSSAINPSHTEILHTYCKGQSVELCEIDSSAGTLNLEELREKISGDVCAVIVQYPNYYGCIEELDKISQITHENGALLIVSVNPVALGILEPPGTYEADIVIGDGQPLGVPLSFGGPYLGIIAVTNKLVRKIPGRISGKTVDVDGKPGFVLVLQTREQHIRREKATSNICTNQALIALNTAIYMSIMGKEGIKEVATQCLQKSHYLAEKIKTIKGFDLLFDKPFFNEFAVQCPIESEELLKILCEKNFLAGISLRNEGYDNGLLIAVTEKRTKEEMDTFVEELKKIS